MSSILNCFISSCICSVCIAGDETIADDTMPLESTLDPNSSALAVALAADAVSAPTPSSTTLPWQKACPHAMLSASCTTATASNYMCSALIAYEASNVVQLPATVTPATAFTSAASQQQSAVVVVAPASATVASAPQQQCPVVAVAPVSAAAASAPQHQSAVVAVAPASAAAASAPQQQSPVMVVASDAAAATFVPQQQSPVVAAIPAAAAATYALQQQSSVVPATPGAEAIAACHVQGQDQSSPKITVCSQQVPCSRFCTIASASAKSAGKLDSLAHR